MDSEGENKRNQEAILRLLNEMGNLADGDLTVQASVTEDVTGAIADSINFTIEELRTLVRGINSATDQVTKATQETQAISNRLYEASQRQNREIQQASASVLQMAQSINEVSQTANQSARVAQQSLAAAEKGGQVVQNQIAGMNEIRTQIQDTSKRIKRLGESSMEIGEIVELISDITEQTNVLALNARSRPHRPGKRGAASRWWPKKCSASRNAPAKRRSRSRRSSRPFRPTRRMRSPPWRSRRSAWSKEPSSPTPRDKR
jgi:twitching motility protein PilJ